MNFYVGTSGFAYKEWKGSFYPEDLPAKAMLRFYGERFRAVEINNSFYRMPTVSVLESWAAEVPPGFRFVLKAPQRITHFQRLKGSEETVTDLFKVAAVLGDRLGPVLFQLPPNMKKDVPRLRDFLALLPRGRQTAVEFRHASWFDDEVLGLLREHNTALCLAEAEDGVEPPFVSTSGFGYLRLRRPDYGPKELKAWLARVQGTDWSDVFVFFKHEDEGTGPKLAAKLLDLAGEGGAAKKTTRRRV
ncbi:MAG: DUF72 domain-containing protein [Phycisphaeraceae bacterium]|nr:DUF72 domain-containing protein [Phycisphaeraceae bacterium]